MRSSTAMPKPYLRSPFSLFFYPTILLHLFISFISLDISYFSHFFFFSLLQRINIKHLFIAPRNLLLVSLVRVHVNFVPSHSSFRSNCHKMTHRDTLQQTSFILRRVNNCANYLSTPSSREKIKIRSYIHYISI